MSLLLPEYSPPFQGGGKGWFPTFLLPFSPTSERSISHTTRSRDGRQEGREGGYYHLHRYLNDTLFHTSPPFFLISYLSQSGCSRRRHRRRRRQRCFRRPASFRPLSFRPGSGRYCSGCRRRRSCCQGSDRLMCHIGVRILCDISNPHRPV